MLRRLHLRLLHTIAGFGLLLVGLAIPTGQVRPAGNIYRLAGFSTESGPDTLATMIVDSIEIDNRNIYDTRQPGYGGLLFRTANKVHLKTRQRIVRQEVLLAKGMPFSRELADETARNLRLRLPLNDAWIEVEKLDDRRVLVRAVTVDQWSLLGGVRSFDRSGKETKVRIGVEEKNLLGQAQFLSFDYFWQDNDDKYVTSSFREPRVLGKPLSLQIDYSSNPEARLTKFTLAKPFYSLAQKLSFSVAVSDGGGRQERFFEGSKIAQWQSRYDATALGLDYRFGPYHRKTTFGVGYLYVSNRMSDRVIADPGLFDPEGFPEDSVYHKFEVGAAQSFLDYVVVRRINGFAYNEDVSLGAQFSTQLGRAFVPGFSNYLHDAVAVSAAGAARLGSLLVNGRYDRSFWFHGSVDYRRLSHFGLWGYFTRYEFMTFAFRSWYVSDRSVDPNPLDLGGKNGLRGYVTEMTSGDRYHVVNLEARFFTGIEILSVLFGAAVFTDMGRTWTSGQPVVVRDYFQSYGAGIRVSLEKLRRSELIRADVAFTPDGHWELLFGTGQYF